MLGRYQAKFFRSRIPKKSLHDMENQNNQSDAFNTASTHSKQEKRELKKQEKEGSHKRIARKRLYKRIMLWLTVVLVVGGSVWGIIKIAQAPKRPSASLIRPVSAEDWIQGNKQAKVVLIEYSDFQCPACGAYHPLVKQLVKEFGVTIALVYRHFPLPQHANAKIAAYAAEAAGRQNKFWEMHDVIFENQDKWAESGGARDVLISYANTLGLNLDQFKKDIDDSAVHQKVEKNLTDGTRGNINHTPTFFLNGKEIENPRSYNEFKDVITSALAQTP